jgi:hypothetical protein
MHLPLYVKKESFQYISTVFQNKTLYFNVIWGLHVSFLYSFFFIRFLRPLSESVPHNKRAISGRILH